MDNVVHFEIPADDVKRAQKFYSGAFGWKIEQYPKMEYWMVKTVETDKKTMIPKEPGAINGGMMKRMGDMKHPIITIRVDDIDSALKRIEKMGGKIAVGKNSIPGMGFTAYFTDTEGNLIGLWQGPKM